MSLDDDEDYLWIDNTSARLRALPFEMADRLPDDRRETYGEFAGMAEWDFVVQGVAGEAVLHGLPITPEEKDLLVRGLRWVVEPHDLAEARVIDPLERAELAARWRFEPAPPAGDKVEKFLVKFCRREPEAKALVTAWRHGPGGERQRVWCLVTAPGADPGNVWVGAVSPLTIDVLGGDRLAGAGVVLEAVAADGQWPAYHRRLMAAAAPVWVAWGFRLGKVVAAQPQPLTLVGLGEGDVVFPGPADHDAVDALVAGWAAHAEGVQAAVRAWAQPGDEAQGEQRTRVYGVVVDDQHRARAARATCLEVVSRATGGPVAVEVAAVNEGPPEHLRRLLDTGVLLWERPEPPEPPG
ncbi:MAG: hypothetical protein KY452_11770 [Actinobacteria bacterium]|nr:hypothetical protein [Actinomycetota bacterium]